jgi:hypothetical protein
VSHSLGPHLLVEVSSGAATCPRALGSAFVRVELRCCHVSHGSRLCLPERELRCCHVSHSPGGLWTIGIKKDLAALGTQLDSCVSKARSCVTKVPADVQDATVHPYSVALGQLTTPGHDYNGDMTRQDGTTG